MDGLPEWFERARCVGMPTELFFPERGDRPEDARSVCELCPIRLRCLEYAVEEGLEFGVWGGMTSEQRKAYRRRRAKKAG